MRDVLVRLVNERYDDALSALRCPVELVWGDDDPDAPVESGPCPGRLHPPGTAHAVSRCRPPAPAHRSRRVARRGRTSIGAVIVILPAAPRWRRAVVSIVVAGPRWLRVAQREHYLVDATTRFALRWWTRRPGQPGRCSASPWPVSCSRRAGRPARFATAAVVAAGPDRPVVAGADLPLGLDAPAAHAGAGVGGPRGTSPWPGGLWPGRARWPRPRPRWRCRHWSTWPVRSRRPSSADWPGPTWRGPRRACGGWRPRWWPSPARSERRPPRATSPIWSGARGPSSPAPPASTTAPGWPVPSTSTWPTAPRSSWPRWAPTAGARSRSCARGSGPTWR